jgi:TolB-like protein
VDSAPAAGDLAPLRLGGFVLCRRRHCLCRGQNRIHLRGRAFSTLVFLVENPGRTLTRDKILDVVWPELSVVPNVVDHAVAEIRHALGDNEASPRFIQTIAREGYCFITTVEEQKGGLLPCAVKDSLAILPFTTLGFKASEKWLGEGLADVLITRIKPLRGIPISPLKAVLRYSDRSENPLDAGRELQAAMVLEGTIRRSGEVVRVTMRLLRVSDGKSLWAATYDEQSRSVFSMEDSICEKVIQALVPKLDTEVWRDD